jgi:hypothetical protein
MWFRHSTQQGGVSALDFLVKVRGVHFVDAVLSLTGVYAFTNYKAMPKAPVPVSLKQPNLPKPFALPKPNKNNDRTVAYLRGRGIERDVIYRCIEAGILYESDKHRCVFVGKDENGVARFACERGVDDDLKKDVSGIPVPDVVIAIIATAIIRLVVYFKGKNAKKYRKDVEYGSARWGA